MDSRSGATSTEHPGKSALLLRPTRQRCSAQDCTLAACCRGVVHAAPSTISMCPRGPPALCANVFPSAFKSKRMMAPLVNGT
jgi:hypothetical protein